MQVQEVKHYDKVDKRVHKVFNVEKASRKVILMDTKKKLKFIKKVEQLVRSSQEYKHYVEFLKKYIDMTQCSFFTNMTNKNGRKVRIEIHHEPFTLFDIVVIVMERWSNEGRPFNHLLIAEEVMQLHYRGLVGLIPLSLTVHQLVHDGKLFIPVQTVYGRVLDFVKEYDAHIPDDLMKTLEVKLQESKKVQDMSILDTSYVYIEVEGFKLPEVISK